MNGVIELEDGITLFENEIIEFAEQYRESYDEEDYKRPEYFSGLVRAVYFHFFEEVRPNKTSRMIYSAENVRKTWRIYAELCARYHTNPTLLEYGSMTGISKETLTDWISGASRGKDLELLRTVRNAKLQCESALEKRAEQANSVGAIFGLKAAFNWSETAPRQEPQAIEPPTQTVEQIAAKYKHIALPEPPVFDDSEDLETEDAPGRHESDF